MNIEELAKLSDEELLGRCAEALEWKKHVAGDGVSYWIDPAEPTGYGAEPPNYPADLNAMHEAEQAHIIAPFSGPENDSMEGAERLYWQYEAYEDLLRQQTLGLGGMWHAKARQRCIAFIAVKQQPVEVKGGGE